MSGEMAASLVLKFADQGSGPATQAAQKITRAFKEVGEAAKSTSQVAISAFQKLANSREILGIRSEKAIQNEIRQTEAAYKRMADSGQASAREMARAQDAVRQKVAGLRQELNGVASSAGRAGSAVRTAVAIGGAYQAGKMVLQGPVKQTMDYSMELAHASNVMFSGNSAAARIAAKVQINDAVMTGVREAKGGVSREDSLAGVKALANSGEYGNDPKAAFDMLPTLTKAAAANNASVVDMANIAIKAKASMGLTNVGRIMDMTAQGGIEGQFETRDMAKWLPKQMAYSKRVGLQGEAGFATLVAANQVSMTTAASADDAGNNLMNLLAKVNGHDTATDAKKLGIPLAKTLADALAKGVGGLDAFMNMTEQVAAKDPEMVKLRTQAKGAKGDDLKANLQAQIGIMEGSSIGKLIQDQQAMSALVALLNGRQKFDGIRDKTMAANGTNADLLSVIADEPGAKAQLAAAESANNMQTALNKVNPLIGMAADAFSGLSQKFPTLTAAAEGATLGTAALAASAFAAAGALALLGGTGGAGGAGMAGKLATAAAGVAGFGLPVAGVLAAGAAGYGAGTLLNMGIDGTASWLSGQKDASLGGLIYDMTHGDKIKGNNSTTPSAGGASFQDMQQPLKIENKIILDGRQISESVNEHNGLNARRH